MLSWTWSSADLLLMKHNSATEEESDGGDEDLIDVSAFDASGTAVCTVRLAFGASTPAMQWAPNGLAAVLYHTAHCFWLLDVSAGVVTRHQLTVDPPHFKIETVAWSPASDRIVFGAQRSGWVMVWSRQGQHPQLTSSGRLTSSSGLSDPSWGSLGRLAFVGSAGHPFPVRDKEVQLYRVGSSGRLEGCCRVPIPHPLTFLNARAVSPDGSMVAADARLEDGEQFGVVIISFDARWERLFLLPFWPWRLQWAANGASLLASTRDSTQHAMLDFA